MKKALLIGINYTTIPELRLNGCIYDIVSMRNMLVDVYGYLPDNIIMLRDDYYNHAYMPTADNITEKLQLLADQSDKLEEIWIHYSGHGSQINKPKQDEVIVPIDYRINGVVTGSELLSIVQQIKCTAIILCDSCHSGTICNLPWVFECDKPVIYDNTAIITNPNIFIMSGCKDSQTSSDTYNEILQKSVGAFSNSFIECLKKNQHNIFILDLYENICDDLNKSGYSQIPLLSTTTNNPKYLFNGGSQNSKNKYVNISSKTVLRNLMQNIMRL